MGFFLFLIVNFSYGFYIILEKDETKCVFEDIINDGCVLKIEKSCPSPNGILTFEIYNNNKKQLLLTESVYTKTHFATKIAGTYSLCFTSTEKCKLFLKSKIEFE
jgi:hypothetical protein